MKHLLYILIGITFLYSCKNQKKEPLNSVTQKEKTEKQDLQLRKVSRALTPPEIDGLMNDEAWGEQTWYPINEFWLGDRVDSTDFQGKYKLCWTPDALYILVQVTDDILFDQNKDPLKFWWDDDCVEVFVDEDNSGGEHQYNHNAFAYHLALDGNVVDMAPGETPTLYNDHFTYTLVTHENISIWELRMSIYAANYVDGKNNLPVVLKPGKKMGFAIAYCDNDSSEQRENFIGSIPVAGDDKNRGWIDAGIFGTLVLSP